MILKADVKLTDKYVFTLDISVNTFYDVPWSTLGKKVTFCIDAKESMEMFEKHAKIWKWKIPKKTEKTVVKSEAKTNVKTRKLANNSPDSMSTLGSVRKLNPQYFFEPNFFQEQQDWKKKVEDHNNRKRESHLRRQRAGSMSSQTPLKKRGRPVPVQEPFEPKVEKVEKVKLPPRRFEERSSLDRTLKGMKLFF